jgi:hypothetical protein
MLRRNTQSQARVGPQEAGRVIVLFVAGSIDLAIVVWIGGVSMVTTVLMGCPFEAPRPVMAPIQYGCNEAEKEDVLAFCQRSDRALRFVLGNTACATAGRWGVIMVLVLLAAIAASVAGLSPG